MGNSTRAYNHAQIERWARREWAENRVYRARETTPLAKFYCLDMFPYPSGRGLHVGHWRNYTISDIVSR